MSGSTNPSEDLLVSGSTLFVPVKIQSAIRFVCLQYAYAAVGWGALTPIAATIGRRYDLVDILPGQQTASPVRATVGGGTSTQPGAQQIPGDKQSLTSLHDHSHS